MTPSMLWLTTAAVVLFLPAAHGQHAQPYTGQQTRSIKALSDDEVKQYLSGAGMGYARAAELNRFPGPMHALELADKLSLTAAQRAQTEALMKIHKDEARELGRKVVEAEAALDALFRSARVTEKELAAHVHAVAQAQGLYRLSHLETHRRMRALLTPQQIARYDELRGYDTAAGTPAHKAQH
jgi:Spy/CpxP family protein refolding chaperone